MSSLNINDYIKSDDSLDYQKIYKNMEEITGFMAQRRREQLYNHIVTQYNEKNNSDSTNTQL